MADELRAVGYARCSTEEEVQKNAIEKQVVENKSAILEHGWRLVDMYVELKSGTSAKRRNEYQRLYDDMLLDKFDIIVIKSQDRLMRDPYEWYRFLNRMLSSGKKLFFYLDNRFYTPDDALLTGIKALLDENYSRDLSKKINNDHRNRQKNGSAVVLTSKTYGLRKTPTKDIIKDEREAEMIKLIYTFSAQGYGSRSISNILWEKGYRNRKGGKISDSVIRRIIRNPLSKGTAVMNRFHYDFNTKRVLKNPEEEWYEHKNAVPAIVDDDLWERGNRGMDARSAREMKNTNHGGKATLPGHTPLSGKLLCGYCKSPYYRTRRRNKEGAMIYEWKCSTYLQDGRKDKSLRRDKVRKIPIDDKRGCDNRHLREEMIYEILENIFQEHYNNYQAESQSIIDNAVRILRQVLNNSDYTKEQELLEKENDKVLHQKNVLMTKLLEDIISDTDFRRTNKALDDNLRSIQEKIGHIQKAAQDTLEVEKRIRQIEDRLNNNGIQKATCYEMLEDIETIVVYPEYFEIMFNSYKLLDIQTDNTVLNDFSQNGDAQPFHLRVPIPPSDPRRICAQSKVKVFKLIQDSVHTPAKDIASQAGIPLATTRRIIKTLEDAGYLRYDGKGCHGRWVILKEYKS